MEPKERPILFTPQMAALVHAGTKTQTRRIVKLPPCEFPYAYFGLSDGEHLFGEDAQPEDGSFSMLCPYGVPGDRLYVRERFAADRCYDHLPPRDFKPHWPIYFDSEIVNGFHKVRSGLHIPRWACRSVLEVVSVRVERVESITESDAIDEGGLYMPNRPGYDDECAAAKARGELRPPLGDSPRTRFLRLFYDINERAPKGSNPWVWVIEFRKVQQ